MISVLLVTAIVLLDQNSGVSLGLFLPLTTLVTPVRLLDHPRGVIELPLLAIGQRQPAQIRLTPVAVPDARSRHTDDAGAEHAVELSFAARRVILTVATVVAVELQLQLQKLTEIGRHGRRGRRVWSQATARWARWASFGVSIRDRRGTTATVAVRVEQFSGVERL